MRLSADQPGARRTNSLGHAGCGSRLTSAERTWGIPPRFPFTSATPPLGSLTVSLLPCGLFNGQGNGRSLSFRAFAHGVPDHSDTIPRRETSSVKTPCNRQAGNHRPTTDPADPSLRRWAGLHPPSQTVPVPQSLNPGPTSPRHPCPLLTTSPHALARVAQEALQLPQPRLHLLAAALQHLVAILKLVHFIAQRQLLSCCAPEAGRGSREDMRQQMLTSEARRRQRKLGDDVR
jgi:hypothetical protein